MLPDLSTLPFWAQFLIYTIFGVSVSVVAILTFLGFKMGQRGAPPASDQARVAAVIVEPSALNAATRAVEQLSNEIRDQTHAVKRSSEQLSDEIKEHTRAMNDLRVEMARSKR